MTKRSPISAPQNIWFDSQQVDNTDLTLEQNYNDTIESSMINNHIGSGILPEDLIPHVIFDSQLATGFLDGVPITPQKQPSDTNFGNQLSITLTNSNVADRRTVKLCIIGLDFQSNLQYEIFYFRDNEIQISHKHFAQVLILLINDFMGDPSFSFNLGGQLVIQEAHPMTLSRAPIMVAQDTQPNLFFRDFFVDGFNSLQALLRAALPLYDISNLNINTTELSHQALSSGDVTTQIGEKFVATTNNIQKITFLLSVQNLSIGNSNNLVWNGDLIASIYPLQSGVDCPTDLAPATFLDFSPSNIPVAQISFNYASLQTAGIILDSIPQPVDFIFSNSSVAGNTIIVPGSYYAATLKRSGAANQCDILISTGAPTVPNSRITTFTGTLWVDIPEQQLWFKIWTDAAKISDGQAYDTGHGIIISKTTVDTTTQTTIDFSQEGISFFGNEVFNAVIVATTNESTPVPDQRTGNPVLTRQQFVPTINLLNTIDLANLEAASEPLIIGAIADKNIKFYNSISSLINTRLYSFTMAHDELLIKIIDDPTDTSRFDTSIITLQTHLLNGDFQGATITPDGYNPGTVYRIADAKLCTMISGDVNGDGIIDENDLNLLETFIGFDMTTGLPLHTQLITDGYTTTVSNGYLTYTQPFFNQFSLEFQVVDLSTGSVIADGYDGVLVANPIDPTLGQFTSATVLFSSITGISDYKLVLVNPSTDANYGFFSITSLDTVSDVITIQKIILTGDTIAQMLRADVDGDFHITDTDGYLLSSYLERLPLSSSPTNTYPGPATNPYTSIGTTFNVIRFRLELSVDRSDDYTSDPSSRALTMHPSPDIFSNDGYFAQHQFVNFPVPLVIQKQLTWDASLIVSNSTPRLVPSIFSSLIGIPPSSCTIDGVQCNVYASPPAFNPGKIDYFVPDNLIIGKGELQRPDGYYYKVDFEVGTIILEIPDGLFGSERTINIMDDFISDYNGSGVTRLGFPAMRFADCSFVSASALANDQLRFSVSIQSFSPNTNGMNVDGYTGVVVDGKMGVAIDYTTGLLTLNFTNLFQDPVLQTLSTKVQVHVYLKRGGFNNQPLFVDSTKVQNMLQLISVFSGAATGGPSALIDLTTDVTGILPIIHGGTGLDGVGAVGTVLTSTGTGLSYQFISDLWGAKEFSLGIPTAHTIPQTDGYGLLDPSFYYKNPIHIYASCGSSTTGLSAAISTIGFLSFRFDSYILEGLQSIKLEAILQSIGSSTIVEVRFFNTLTGYIALNGSNQEITSNNTSYVLIRSDDIKSSLLTGTNDSVYQVRASISGVIVGGSQVVMSRLVLTYDNPISVSPPLAHSYNFHPYPIFPNLPS